MPTDAVLDAHAFSVHNNYEKSRNRAVLGWLAPRVFGQPTRVRLLESHQCVLPTGDLFPCLSTSGLVRVGYAHACAFNGTVRFPHTEESRASPISRLGVCLERARVCVRECGVSECGCGVCAFVVVPSQKKLSFRTMFPLISLKIKF